MSNFFRSLICLVLLASIGCHSMQTADGAPEPQPIRHAVKRTAEHASWWAAMAVAAPVYVVKNAADRVQGR
ncbi:MAG: hypothetical protein K2X38_17800 [Gemmataceae bacterium]|nr:hypothetical protein [Gemmataceae bacterium]